MARTIIGLMGAGDNASDVDIQRATEIGRLIAHRGWTLLTGGRRSGVMHAASRGAKEHAGLVIGILPGNDLTEMSEFVDIPIITDMGSARNNINVLSSRVVIACGLGAGTASEIALALKARKRVVLLCDDTKAIDFFSSLSPELVSVVSTPDEAVEAVVVQLENELEGEWHRPPRRLHATTDRAD